jgi:hypothetical protein
MLLILSTQSVLEKQPGQNKEEAEDFYQGPQHPAVYLPFVLLAILLLLKLFSANHNTDA